MGALITSLFDSIIERLAEYRELYELMEHDSVLTSEMASSVCNHPVEQGTKSLALSRKGRIVVATIAGNERFNFSLIAQLVGEKKLSMVNEDSLVETLGTHVGGLAPFGYSHEIRLVVSARLFAVPFVYFNPGRNDRTTRMEGHAFQRTMIAEKAIIFGEDRQ